jgi:hypothetical protein
MNQIWRKDMKAHEPIQIDRVKFLIAAPIGTRFKKHTPLDGGTFYYEDVVALAMVENDDGQATLIGIINKGDYLDWAYDGTFDHEKDCCTQDIYVTASEDKPDGQ